MNSEQFVSVIKKVVREAAIQDILDNIEDPPGRRVSAQEKEISEWFNELPDMHKEFVNQIISTSVDHAIFGFLCVLDGVRAIDNENIKGQLELTYKNEMHERLNDPDKIALHELYNN